MLRRQRAIEIVPSSKPLRWRRYDVPQHLAPETSDALRFCAVEGDLDLLDRRHRSTIEAGLSSSPRARPWLGCGACGRLLKMCGALSRGMTILTVSMPTTFGSPVGLTEPDDAAAQALRLASEGHVQTICVHSDTPGSVEIAAAVAEALRRFVGQDSSPAADVHVGL